MIIECKSCRRKYSLDDSIITPPGSSVRCSKCGHIFFVSKKKESPSPDKLKLSEKTSPFEDLNEEVNTEQKEIEIENNDASESTIISETDRDEITEDSDSTLEQNQETDLDLIDIPTEHQIDLEEYIDKKLSEEDKTDSDTQTDILDQGKSNVPYYDLDKEEIDESTLRAPEFFDDEDLDNEIDHKLESDTDDESKIFDTEDDKVQDLPVESIYSHSMDDENTLLEENPSENSTETPERGKISKSSTGIFARFIYTLMILAAIIVIFIASLVILIKAEILPKGTLSNLTNFVETIIPLGLNNVEIPEVVITEHKARWMNTRNGPVYIVSGLITNNSQTPVHYVKLRSEYIAGEKRLYEDTIYAGNTFTDRELKSSPMQNILSKLDQKNGDIDLKNPRKLAGLNYNIQPGESIPFFTVFPADGRVLGLKYNLELLDYKKAPSY